MGAAQASGVVYNILARNAGDRTAEELAALRERVKADYLEQTDSVDPLKEWLRGG